MPRRRLAVLTLALVGALTAGCATPAPVADTPTATPTLEVSPTPTPSETPHAGPVLAFDGDCAQMLTTDQRDAILGVGSRTAQEHAQQMEPDRPLPIRVDVAGTLGGLGCTWYAAEGADLPDGLRVLTVMVLPASSVPKEYAAKYSVAVCESNYGTSACRLGRTAGESWVSASVGDAVPEPPRELLASAIDAVAENLASTVGRARPITLTDQVWSIPDCESLGRDIRLDELIGPYVHGHWEGKAEPEDDLFRAAGVLAGCPLFTDPEHPDSEAWEFHYLTPYVAPGLAWQWDELRADAENSSRAVDVEGAADAFAVDQGYGASIVFATDGTNVVSLYSQNPDLAVQIVGRIMTSLSS